MKKVFQKLLVLFTALVTVLGLGISSVSAAAPADRAELKITGLTGSPTVKLYKVADAKYNAAGDSFIDWTFASNVSFADLQKPTSSEITKIANNIRTGIVTPLATYNMTVSGSTATYQAEAGIYIALVTSGDDRAYNPILLTASYNGEGVLSTDAVSSTATYLYGQTAVAKSSQPTIDKTVTGAKDDGGKNTASIGQVLTYTIAVTLPDYPENANNKTVWVGDTMSAGLTFDYASLEVAWNGQTVKPNASGEVIVGGVTIAKVAKAGNGFNMVFNYDNLKNIQPKITYNGIVNNAAVVGTPGNANDATYIYSNDPTKGSTHNTTDKPTGEGLKEIKDSEIVYTYELAFKKTGENNAPLAGAVFGIYSDAAATKLVDVVTTNAAGIATSTQVGKGTYYIKEIKSPAGYSLNTNVYSIEASWATATTKNTVTSTKSVYTAVVGEAQDPTQVGWLTAEGAFFALATPADQRTGAVAAYVKSSTTTTASNTSLTEKGAGSGTVGLADAIPNTKLSKLPSTGGMGTYLFTFIGVVVMAAAVLFAKRNKKS